MRGSRKLILYNEPFSKLTSGLMFEDKLKETMTKYSRLTSLNHHPSAKRTSKNAWVTLDSLLGCETCRINGKYDCYIHEYLLDGYRSLMPIITSFASDITEFNAQISTIMTDIYMKPKLKSLLYFK